MTDKIKSLHSCWNIVTGQELNYRATERLFYELFKMDFTEDDLKCVLLHVMGYNKTHKQAPMKIQVHKLLGDLEVFASILAEARAKQRNAIPKPTPKQEVLHAFRGITPESNGNSKHIAEVFAELKRVTS